MHTDAQQHIHFESCEYNVHLHATTNCRQKTIFHLLRWASFLMTAFGFGTLFAHGVSFILHLVCVCTMRWNVIRFELHWHHNTSQCTCMPIALDIIPNVVVDIHSLLLFLLLLLLSVCSNRFFSCCCCRLPISLRFPAIFCIIKSYSLHAFGRHCYEIRFNLIRLMRKSWFWLS